VTLRKDPKNSAKLFNALEDVPSLLETVSFSYSFFGAHSGVSCVDSCNLAAILHEAIP
jgi:hypothetical protein